MARWKHPNLLLLTRRNESRHETPPLSMPRKTRGVLCSATLNGSGNTPRLCSRPGRRGLQTKETRGGSMLKIVVAALAAVFSLSHAEAQAQAYPSKPVRFVIPFGAGSATDALARIAGQELEQTLGQPIIVVQKPGADGALAATEVKRAAPDGYTFMFGTNSPLAVVPNMQKEPPYNVLTDFTPVTFLGENTFFIVVHPSLPPTTLDALVAYAKASPKPLNYATGNTYAFISMAMLATNNRIQLEAIRYKSEPDALADLLSGRVPLMNATSTSVAAHVAAGRLRALSTSFDE